MSAVRPDKAKLFYRKPSAGWWLAKRSYFLFMLRELSSAFIAIFFLVFLIQLYQLSRGPEAYLAFAQQLGSPRWLIFNFVILLFALYHSITWFRSSAIVLPLQVRDHQVTRRAFVALNIGLLVIVSLAILMIFVTFNA